MLHILIPANHANVRDAMLTTIHNIGEEWTVTRERRRPRETSSNANTVLCSLSLWESFQESIRYSQDY